MNKMKTAGFSLLVIGLVLLAIPLYAEWKGEKKAEALERALQIVNEQDGKIEKTKDMPFSEEQLSKTMELEIPVIGLKEKVLPETTKENLGIALTQIKTNQNPERDNFTIAGHRGYKGNRHFRQLPDLKEGDEILLRSRSKTYAYKVNDIRIIDPAEVGVLENDDGKREITLITCTIDGKKRIAVKGDLQ